MPPTIGSAVKLDKNVTLDDFVDATEYSFGSPSTGRKVLIGHSHEVLDDKQFGEVIEGNIERITGYFKAKLIEKSTDRLKNAEVATLVFDLPAEPGIDGSRRQWVGIVRFRQGDSATLSLLAKGDDREAAAEYRRLLASVQKTGAKLDPLAALRQTLAGPPEPGPAAFPAGVLTIDLTDDYSRPTEFWFSNPLHDQFTLKLLSAPSVAKAPNSGKADTFDTIRDEDGKPVRVLKSRDLWSKRPSATSTAVDPLATITKVKQLATELGGIEKLKQIVETLSE
jgi:hypothetical protein